ncbi:MAG: PcfJ domain-containing protein, partial [Treponema sp.]|nr:PcfJ domain-containing protein [Treponema sp.]
LLNSERAIADEGSSMHHCIYTNYCRALKDRRMIAFHVVNEDGDFTCSFHICKDDIVFDQAHKAWNKTLTVSEMEFAKSLESYVGKLLILNPIKQKNYFEDLDLF